MIVRWAYTIDAKLFSSRKSQKGKHAVIPWAFFRTQIRLIHLCVSFDFRKHISLLVSCNKNVIKLYNAHM